MCSNFSSADASPWIIIQCRVYKLRKYPYGTKSYYSWDDYCSTPTVLVWLTSWWLLQLIHESLSKENKLGERLLSHFSSIFSLFQMDTIDPTVRTFWRGAYWRALRPNRMEWGAQILARQQTQRGRWRVWGGVISVCSQVWFINFHSSNKSECSLPAWLSDGCCCIREDDMLHFLWCLRAAWELPLCSAAAFLLFVFLKRRELPGL